MSQSKGRVIVVAGPTAVGKTAAAIAVAGRLGSEVISADSRQVYADIPITTAAPTAEELAQVRHHLVGMLPLDAPWSAAMFQAEAMRLLPEIFERTGGTAVLCGGSSLYIDALCRGLHPVPDITGETRNRVRSVYEKEGLAAIGEWLRTLDPEYYARIDRCNPRRIMHGIELCLQTGRTVTDLRSEPLPELPFTVERYELVMERPQLFERINMRVLKMAENGMIEEAKANIHRRELQALDTVGFHEMFRYLDGEWTLDFALARLQKNTRVYAKKQITYLARSGDYTPVTDWRSWVQSL